MFVCLFLSFFLCLFVSLFVCLLIMIIVAYCYNQQFQPQFGYCVVITNTTACREYSLPLGGVIGNAGTYIFLRTLLLFPSLFLLLLLLLMFTDAISVIMKSSCKAELTTTPAIITTTMTTPTKNVRHLQQPFYVALHHHSQHALVADQSSGFGQPLVNKKRHKQQQQE